MQLGYIIQLMYFCKSKWLVNLYHSNRLFKQNQRFYFTIEYLFEKKISLF